MAVSSLVAAGLIAAVLSVSFTAPPEQSTEPATHATESLTAAASPPSLLPSSPPPDEPVPVSAAEQAALAEAVSRAVNEVVPGTEVGLAVHDQLTGKMLTSVHADEQFYTASVVKLLIGIQVLRQANWEVPTGTDRDELAAMLSGSSDWVAAALWGAHGGPAITTEVTALVGLDGTSPPRNPQQWEMTRMSPRDVLRVYQYIDNEMPQQAREFVLTALATAPALATDGFDQFFGIPGALPDTGWAIKQGWMRIDNGLVLNTTGIVGSDRRYLVALLTRQPGGTSFEDGRAAVTAGIAALTPALNVATRTTG